MLLTAAFALPLLLSTTDPGVLALNASTGVSLKEHRLVGLLRSESQLDRDVAHSEIQRLGRKTPKDVRPVLIAQLAREQSSDLKAAGASIRAVGKPMTKVMREALSSGAADGVEIPLDRLVSAALGLDPTGKRFLPDFLETRPLTAPIAKAIAVAGDSSAAFRLLCDQAKRPESRSAALSGIRVARTQRRLPSARVMQDAINEVWTSTGKEVGQMLRDASHDDDPAALRDRMKAWLEADDPALVESALWSVGYQGRDFLDLAPQVAGSLGASDTRLAAIAHWALGSLKEEGMSCHVPGLALIQSRALAIGGGAGSSAMSLGERRRLLNLVAIITQVEDGVLRRPPMTARQKSRLRPNPARRESQTPEGRELGEHADDVWSFAPEWIDRLFATRPETQPKTPTEPTDELPTRPEAIERALQAMTPALESDDPLLSLAAGMAHIEWEVATSASLRWCLTETRRHPEGRTRWLIQDFLDAHVTHEFFGSDEAIDTAAEALEKSPGAVHLLSILLNGKSDRARAAVARYLQDADPERAWSNREHHLFWAALQVDEAHLSPLLPLAAERFLAGDYRMTPYLALAGETAHPILQTALADRVLDRRMVAVAVLRAQKKQALALLPRLESMGSLPEHAQTFLDATLTELRALR